MSYMIAGGDFNSAGAATRQLKEQLVRIGVGATVIRRVMIASYEAEMNVVIHARTGTLWARLDGQTLDLEVADEGPGIPDVEKALTEGWSTASEKARALGFGAGMGLPNIRRNSDYFEIETRVGRGTRVRSRIRLEGLAAASDGVGAETGAAEECPSLDAGKCRRCLRCIFACPAGALRVHETGPSLIRELCIGCTACIATCTRGVYGLLDGAAGAGARTDAAASDVREAARLEVPDGVADAARGAGHPGPYGAAAAAQDAEFQVPGGAVLVLPRAFLCGFGAEASPDRVLARLTGMGFAAVRFTEEWEAAIRAAARAAADAADPVDAPVIPPVCPAVVALVESRFPSLIPSLGPWMTPIEAAGEEFPLQPVVVVPACPSQHGRARASSLSGRLTLLSPRTLARAIRDCLNAAPGRDPKGSADHHLRALPGCPKGSADSHFRALPGCPEGRIPGRGPQSADPSAAVTARGEPEQARPGTLRVTGVRHVMAVLAAAEAGALAGTRLLDLSMCDTGCSGSPLVCADPYLAAARALPAFAGAAGETVTGPVGGQAAGAPASAVGKQATTGAGKTVVAGTGSAGVSAETSAEAPAAATGAASASAAGEQAAAVGTDGARAPAVAVNRRLPWAQRPGLRLDPDMGNAIRKLAAIDARARALPGRDCGACGAPTCTAFAEDVVLGRTAQTCPHAESHAPKEDCP